MNFLELKIPPPIIMLLCAVLSWISVDVGSGSAMVAFEGATAATLVWPVSFVLIGIAVALAGVLEFKKFSTTVNPLSPDKASCIVDSGIFSFTRNPMYLGMLLVLIGWGDFLDSLIAFIGAGVFFLYIDRFQIKPEEQILSDNFGEPYVAYLQRVRRWI